MTAQFSVDFPISLKMNYLAEQGNEEEQLTFFRLFLDRSWECSCGSRSCNEL